MPPCATITAEVMPERHAGPSTIFSNAAQTRCIKTPPLSPPGGVTCFPLAGNPLRKARVSAAISFAVLPSQRRNRIPGTRRSQWASPPGTRGSGSATQRFSGLVKYASACGYGYFLRKCLQPAAPGCRKRKVGAADVAAFFVSLRHSVTDQMNGIRFQQGNPPLRTARIFRIFLRRIARLRKMQERLPALKTRYLAALQNVIFVI